MKARPAEAKIPHNDAHLVQLVRGALGRSEAARGLPRINVSSCKLVVALHGTVSNHEARNAVVEVVRAVPGVRGVVNKLKVSEGDTGTPVFPRDESRVSKL